MEEENEKDFFLNTNILLSFFHFSKFAIKWVRNKIDPKADVEPDPYYNVPVPFVDIRNTAMGTY